jgi:hypothetical protein
MSTSTITTDQLRNREIAAADLLRTSDDARLHSAPVQSSTRATIITAPSAPMSVFGRKMAGHEG